MQRRSTSQDISWFLDLRRSEQLDLDPPYQRHSVWNGKDRRFFLDTVFRGYPCPPIFLHKTVNEDQKTLYPVVDGKQRLQTLFMFVDDEIALSDDFGDTRFNGKKWSQLEAASRKIFWDYVLPVEFLTFNPNDPQEVNHAFDRLNRNMRKLDAQELRHARWGGWFITCVEHEAEDVTWQSLGVVTKARSKRMKDAQFLSELLLVSIENRIAGFDQQQLDAAYGKYDDIDEMDDPPDTEAATSRWNDAKAFLLAAQSANGCVKEFASTLTAFYTLWALVVLHSQQLPEPKEFATRYAQFMSEVARLADAAPPSVEASNHALEYSRASRGASTDLTPRKRRLDALRSILDGTP